jgi:N-acetylmuramoyl-L-alanine amidase
MQSYKITHSKMEKMLIDYRICAIILFFTLCFQIEGYAQKDELSFQTIKTVCIDAGHGGKDPGCHGAFSNEKTVCLNMALMLGKMIQENYPQIKVVYTRDRDVFVELDDRAKIANKNKADLFICIHANAASPSAFGTETFVLGLHRTEAQQKVAERENSTIFLEEDGGLKYKDFDMSPDALIARQLQLSIFLDQSIIFATKLQREFKGIGRYDRGVKQAGFLVLYKTTMPSVLIETGFLTNKEEEKFLADAAGQSKMAESMFIAFQKYKNELEGVDEMKGVKPIEFTSKTPTVEKSNPIVEKSDNVIFRVQVETSSTKIPTTSPKFKGFKVYEYQQDNLYKYTIGEFENDYNSANKLKNDLRENGFPHAFIVVFQGNERINLEKGIKLAKN